MKISAVFLFFYQSKVIALFIWKNKHYSQHIVPFAFYLLQNFD